MKLLFFGRLKQAIAPELEMDVPAGSSIRELRERLVADYPDARAALARGRVRACVGSTLVGDDHIVLPGDSVEFLPPVSGG